METRRKRRVIQHIMEDESYKIIREQIPKHWVIREFNHPDYGIDLVIELFDPMVENPVAYEALGEYIYVQVKAVQQIDIKKERFFSVGNVAKGAWTESKEEFVEVDVIKFVLDTNFLLTVEQSGSGISILLFVVDLSSKKSYFICLNDLIDKYILPKNMQYHDKNSITLTIPVLNELGNNEVANTALSMYGKRAKMLSAFAKFFYQRNEILNYFQIKECPVITYRDELEKTKELTFNEFCSMVEYFIAQIDQLDIWRIKDWYAIEMSYAELSKLQALLKEKELNKVKVAILDQTMLTWHSLCNLANIYEELVREWFLPKYLSFFTSYPKMRLIMPTFQAI